MKGSFRSLAVNCRRLGEIRGFAGRGNEKGKGLFIHGVEDIIAVASGKGGVGKSTTAVNLAVALANKCQLKVGLLDADVYGPSVPTMMKLHGKPETNQDLKMIPKENYGVKCMSMGLLVEKDAPIVWRGPMVMNALQKLVRGVDWGELDILVIDMPPGTGDAQLTISQQLKLSGAIIVSTPQDIALMDARRGAKMFSKVDVPIIGVIENMSCFKCPHCGEASYIFGEGGARKTAAEMSLQYLGDILIEVDIRKCCDEGVPLVVSSPDSAVSKAYNDIARKVVDRIEELKRSQFHPQISL
ncbi:hypothetical protein Dimus_032372 [Dionaea muscipula]